jgi:site-specific recombinase
MTFYTLKFIQNNQDANKTVWYILMIIATIAMVLFAVLYLRNRFTTRYRDLGIIALLFLLLFVGTRYEKYVQTNAQKSQSVQIVPFIKSVAKDFNVKNSDVMVNSTTLQDGIIVRIKPNKEDYQLNLNTDNNSYTLKRAHVIDHRVIVKN